MSQGVEQEAIIFKDAMKISKFVQEARLASHGAIEDMIFQDIVEEPTVPATTTNETEPIVVDVNNNTAPAVGSNSSDAASAASSLAGLPTDTSANKTAETNTTAT